MGYGEFIDPAIDLESSSKEQQMDVIRHTIGVIREIQHRMEPLEIEDESGADMHLSMVVK